MATNFTDHGGTLIQFVRLQMIYWGSAWASNPPPTPTTAQVTDAMNRILSGGYLTGLAQYRGVSQGYILGSVTVTSSSPTQNFTDANVATLIQNLISAGTVPNLDAGNQTLYMVITPKGINHQGGGAIGEHTYYTDGNNRRVHFAWVTNNGTLSSISIIASHEIAESMTDPEGSAVLGDAGTCSGTGWCEIGDVCQGTDGTVNGASVQSLWSESAKQCVVFDYPSYSFPIKGVQFTGTLAANQTQRWFTFNWPSWWQMFWSVMPTTVNAAGSQLTWSVGVQRASGAYITYWVTVTNQTNVPVAFQARYQVLGLWNTGA